MPLVKRGKRNKRYFYEYRRGEDGQVQKCYVGRQGSPKALAAAKREEQRKSQKEESRHVNQLADALMNEYDEYRSVSDLLFRSQLLQQGLYKRGTEIRKVRRDYAD